MWVLTLTVVFLQVSSGRISSVGVICSYAMYVGVVFMAIVCARVCLSLLFSLWLRLWLFHRRRHLERKQ